MTTEEKKATIEEQIAEERDALTDRLKSFSEEFSPDKMLKSIGDTISQNGGEIAEQVLDGVRRNPVAAGLVGAGLAWLLIDRSGSETETNPSHSPALTSRAPGLDDATFEPEFSERLDAATDQSKSDIATTTSAAKQTALEMRDRLYDGTSQLSDIARARVVAARERAVSAQEQLEQAAQQASTTGAEIFSERPLLVGAAAFAAGAAIAYALPRTETENNAFGAKRDSLVADADAILAEEIERAKALGSAALSEAQDTVSDALGSIPTGKDAVDAAEKKVADFSKRVKTKAEADRAS